MLVIDTASRAEGIALAHGAWAVSVQSRRTRRGHSSILLPAIERQLDAQGWKVTDLDGFGVVVGPGSFTGIRVGVATIDGLARATGAPAFGYGSLEVRAMALQHAGAVVVPILDARKGEVYGAAYASGGGSPADRVLLSPRAAAPDALAAALVDVPGEALLACGGGARLYEDRFRAALGDRFQLAPGGGDLPGVASFAVEVARRVAAGDAPLAGELAPIYLRPSQAELTLPRP